MLYAISVLFLFLDPDTTLIRSQISDYHRIRWWSEHVRKRGQGNKEAYVLQMVGRHTIGIDEKVSKNQLGLTNRPEFSD